MQAASPTVDGYACRACGGALQWNPAKQTLACSSCGSAVPCAEVSHFDLAHQGTPLTTGRVSRSAAAELDARVAIRCKSCDAVSLLATGISAQCCPFCGSSDIAPCARDGASSAPQCIIPLMVSADAARDLAHAWCSSRWLAPGKLKRLARTDTLTALYMPVWVFGATVSAHWKRTPDADEGDLHLRYDDVIVPATHTVDDSDLRHLEPFPADRLAHYHPQWAAGWTVQRADIALQDAIATAHQRLQELLIERARGGGARRKITLSDVRYDAERCTLALLPLWLLTYRYLGRNYLMTINGATGKAIGTWPFSRLKVALATLAAVEVFIAIYIGPEVAVQVPWWILQGFWWLITLPFSR